MITEAILGVVIDIMTWILGQTAGAAKAALGIGQTLTTIYVPTFISQVFLEFMASYSIVMPLAAVWWIWRQVKG